MSFAASASSSCSPLRCLPAAELTPAGLLKLDATDGEVELMRRSKGIELRCDLPPPNAPISAPWVDRDADLTLVLTTHRLVLQINGDSGNGFFHLSNVQHIEATGGPTISSWNASHKLLVMTYSLGEFILSFRTASSAKDRDEVERLMDQALSRKAWEQSAQLAQKRQTASHKMLTKRKVGVDAILTKSKLQHQEHARLAKNALSGDAEQLLSEAAELIGVIRKYVTTIHRNQQQKQKEQQAGGGDEGGNGSGMSDEDAMKLNSLLEDMGMTSALSKADLSTSSKFTIGKGSSTTEYHELVARQVADFLHPKWDSVGGILTMTDVFCLFNRARGSNLISPEDLRSAMGTAGKLELGISARTFPSGLAVVQQSSWDDNKMAQKLADLCKGGMTSLQASRALHTSPLLAQEHLASAERLGVLCRDVTLETVRFFPNRFGTFQEAVLSA
mmetsp:Transcript_4763/g.12517  ORF Transcript_4763/g.12517 Transcript_4763/m.12517 type:complete len:446 (-) Transcript_4763:41-1378(-)|eukprot:CAMPEP_0198130488 /NCGR_PEP_ID=MMETSP1442-20131203/54102_1 /TAXON_ID= /ORGANISM="Craspedostauros australis, Strain CCMP3328" /LENGTH=445 /DNA_ID=CAMNT_0043791117 /DNA_START=354 /DNA_END=1691 /DNA_ORIENTATION=+